MKMIRAGAAIGGAMLAFAAIGAACGSPTPKVVTTPTDSVASPAPTMATSVDATAIFEATNRKLAANHQPTLVPGSDPLRPYANETSLPVSTNTPGPSPTPDAPLCGSTIAGWPEILAQYGEIYKGNRCGPIGTQLVILTRGRDGGPGAIATYQCQPADQGCLRGEAPSAPDARWSVYPAPYAGAVAILGGSATLLIIDNGGAQICFDMTAHKYDLTLGCRP